MIIYNVTIKIDLDVHDEWLAWMKLEHIPRVRNVYFNVCFCPLRRWIHLPSTKK